MVIGIDASRAYIKNRTGTENYSYQIIRSILRSRDAKLHRFVLFVGPGYDNREIPKGTNIEVVEVSWRRLWTQVGLAIETWRRDIDVLFVPAHTLPVLRKPGIKTVVTIHGLEYEWLPEYKNSLQRWYLPMSTIYAARSSTHIIAVSDFTRVQLIERLGVSGAKVDRVYEGVDRKIFETKAAREFERRVISKFELRSRYIAFVGTIMPRKNLAFMIRVYRRLLKKYSDLEFVIAGARGWMYEDVMDEIRLGVLEEKVKMVGRVTDEELPVILRNASIYVQPSITEGFGLPVLEAMAAGVVVVSSSGGALPEIVGDSGVVVDQFEESEWVRVIDKLLSNTRERAKYIKRGRERAKEFNWDMAGEKTLEILISK